MGLDIYVGSLTRYLAGDWENVAERYAREQGIEFTTIRPGAEIEDTITDPQIIFDAVGNWRRSLEVGLQSNLPEGLSWNENLNSVYFTDRPAWEGYSGVILHAAHMEHPHFPRPKQAMKEWDADEAVIASMSTEFKSRFSHLLGVEIWLPCKFAFTFKAEDVVGNKVVFGSSLSLLEQLKALNEESYLTNSAELAKWKYEVGGQNNSFEASARLGLGMFLNLAEMAVRHKLPMKLDY
jgi:hypothetical protein